MHFSYLLSRLSKECLFYATRGRNKNNKYTMQTPLNLSAHKHLDPILSPCLSHAHDMPDDMFQYLSPFFQTSESPLKWFP